MPGFLKTIDELDKILYLVYLQRRHKDAKDMELHGR
jgi:hypothetical protein